MKHGKYLCLVKQIAPDDFGNPVWDTILRTSLGSPGWGKHKAWVRVSPYPGWDGKPAFGRLYYDRLILDANDVPFANNQEATSLLRQPDTELIGPQTFDPGRATICGYAWLVLDEGWLCRTVKLARGHDASEIEEWVEQQNMSKYFSLHYAQQDSFLVQFISQEDA